ncbi:YidB family protein [Methylotenera sp. G11]|uniref:YidB family protein n=1 Tax=Methylotenera sp. G11 TaxID=1506585 RepID=UPI00064870AF|nr:YidB family protein [Methylotenera sp. G11]
MGLFDSLAGSMLGKLGGEKGAIAQVAVDLFNQNGGLPGVLEKFKAAGFADEVASWVGKGANQQISAAQITQVLGSATISTAAARLGLNADEISSKIAEYLPQVIDRMTPDGEVGKDSGNLLATMLGMLK